MTPLIGSLNEKLRIESMAAKSVLVVLRCGDNSLHRPWRNESSFWDLAASYFGSNAELQFPEATYVHRYRGGKWDGIFDFFQQYPDALQKYDYFWFPDDDIAADPESLNRFFEMVSAHNFELAQPSLRQGSYCSHLITLHNPYFIYRNVNFVELMVPLVSQDLCFLLLPLFKHARTGFGIDFIWNRFTSDPARTVAIVDAVQVEHTRAVGGALHTMVKKEGMTTPQEEEAIFLAPYGNVSKILVHFGGLTRSGRETHSQFVTSIIAALGWLSRPSGNSGFTTRISPYKFAVWVVRHLVSCLQTAPRLQKLRPIVGSN